MIEKDHLKKTVYNIARQIILEDKCISKKNFIKRLKKRYSYDENVFMVCYEIIALDKKSLIEMMMTEFNIAF